MNKTKEHHCKSGKKHFYGPSSLHMQDPTLIFNVLKLKAGDVFLDLGCGSGDYSFIAARTVGPEGRVYAVDLRSDTMERIGRIAESSGLDQLHPMVADLTEPLPFDNGTADLCFLCTVLHGISSREARSRLFREMVRILKPGGRAVCVDCKKEPSNFGPPIEMRLSTEEIDGYARAAGFEKGGETDLGHNILMQFRKPVSFR